MPVINTGKTTRATNPDLINTELASCFMLSNSSGLCRYWHDGQAPDWNTTTGEPQTLQDADLSSSNDKDAPIIVIHLTLRAWARNAVARPMPCLVKGSTETTNCAEFYVGTN